MKSVYITKQFLLHKINPSEWIAKIYQHKTDKSLYKAKYSSSRNTMNRDSYSSDQSKEG